MFTSFTLGQTGMVRHWNRALRTERDPAERRRIMRSRAINAFGASLTGVVLVIVRHHQVQQGRLPGADRHADPVPDHAWHQPPLRRVAEELATDELGLKMPSRNHVVVLVSKVHKPTLRALAYARATRPDTLTALTVNVDDETTRNLLAEWERHDLPVQLTVLESPYREITRPIIEYVKKLRADSPRDLVSVFIPEYVVGRWWEQLLHNQSALRLKTRLLFQPGVMVTSVPWQLTSSERLSQRPAVSPAPRRWTGTARRRRGPARAEEHPVRFTGVTSMVDRVGSPADLRRLEAGELPQLAAEIRDLLVQRVSRTGGHLGPNLGVVELTIAAAPGVRLAERADPVRHRPPGVRAQDPHRPGRPDSTRCARPAACPATRAAPRASTTGSRTPTPRPRCPTPTGWPRRSRCAGSDGRWWRSSATAR